MQHVVDFSPYLYPHLLPIFLLFARREILHSYGFEHMPLLYNLEKAGLVKRQVSQSSFSMNLVFFLFQSLQLLLTGVLSCYLFQLFFTSIFYNIILFCAGIEE
jgi:hypothetical protein